MYIFFVFMYGEESNKMILEEGGNNFKSIYLVDLCFLCCLVVVFVIWFGGISYCLMEFGFGGRDGWSLGV